MKNQIFNKNQISALTLSLEKSISPLKYSYITEKWAKWWYKIEKDRAKKWWNYAEYELLRDNIDIYLWDIWNPKEVCFFDFWCGTLNTPKWMLEKLVKRWIKVHYHWFDISQNIIKLAKSNIGELWNNYTFNSTILDFEIFNLSNILIDIRNSYNNLPVIGMLLWNTIWNFDSIERIILNIMESFRIEDRMIIWIEKSDLNNEKRMNHMIEWYKSKDVFNLTFSTLEFFWVNSSEWSYNVIFNKEKNVIEWYFQLNNDLELKIWNKIINFEEWDKIKLFQSKKMNESSFTKLLLDLDLRIWSTRTNIKDTFIQAMIWAKKY